MGDEINFEIGLSYEVGGKFKLTENAELGLGLKLAEFKYSFNENKINTTVMSPYGKLSLGGKKGIYFNSTASALNIETPLSNPQLNVVNIGNLKYKVNIVNTLEMGKSHIMQQENEVWNNMVSKSEIKLANDVLDRSDVACELNCILKIAIGIDLSK